MPAVYDHVDGAVLEQKFRALKTFRQRLSYRLLDYPRPGKPDQRVWLGNDHIAKKREACRHSTHGWIGQHGNKRQSSARQLRQRRGGLRHLHQRRQTFLHSGAAARRKTYEGQILIAATLHSAHKALANHRAHRTTQEPKLECCHNHRHVLDGPLHHYQRIVLVGLGFGRLKPLCIAPAVNKLQEINRLNFGSDLESTVRIESQIDAFASGYSVVVTAFRTDVEILVQVRTIKHRFANFAFAPQPFGDGFLDATRAALDLWREQLLQPAHPRLLIC